jgi:hypothetical protein
MANTKHRTITWTCDQCGKVVTDEWHDIESGATWDGAPVYGDPPSGWFALTRWYGGNTQTVHLCSVQCLRTHVDDTEKMKHQWGE